MLSKENEDRLVLTGLYYHEPVPEWVSQVTLGNLYWCRNWTFRVRKNPSDNNYYMVDTYFDNKSILLTDDNFDGFQLIFDFNDVRPTSHQIARDYSDEDVYHVPVDSGGMKDGGKWFIKIDAKRDLSKVCSNIEEDIEKLQFQLRLKMDELERIKKQIAEGDC